MKLFTLLSLFLSSSVVAQQYKAPKFKLKSKKLKTYVQVKDSERSSHYKVQEKIAPKKSRSLSSTKKKYRGPSSYNQKFWKYTETE